MAVTMTINGLAEKWEPGSLRITDNINARSTSRFRLHSEHPIAVGQEVIITDNETRIFGGTIHSFSKSVPKGTTLKQYDIVCVNFNQIADRKIIGAAYEDKTVAFIVQDLSSQALEEEGVTLGSLATDPTMQRVVFNYRTVAQCLEYIQNATGLNWRIDYHKVLSVFAREDSVGLGFTDDNNNFMDMTVERTREEYRNRQIIRSGLDVTDLQVRKVPTPAPDGSSRIFKVRYPLAEKPTIYINDLVVAETDVGINGLDVGKKWYWNEGSADIVQDENEAVLEAVTDVIEVTFRGLYPIFVQVDEPSHQAERAAIEGGTGVYSHLEQLAGLDDRQATLDYAAGLLVKYATIPQIVQITTEQFRQAGQLVPMEVTALGVSVDIFDRGNRLEYNIRCLSGEALGSWVEFFRRLRESATSFVIRENEVLILLTSFQESAGWSEGWQQLVHAYPVVSEDLYSGEELYPC